MDTDKVRVQGIGNRLNGPITKNFDIGTGQTHSDLDLLVSVRFSR
jgi:hypothetical protein